MENKRPAPSNVQRLNSRYEQLRRKRESLAGEIERLREAITQMERELHLDAQE